MKKKMTVVLMILVLMLQMIVAPVSGFMAEYTDLEEIDIDKVADEIAVDEVVICESDAIEVITDEVIDEKIGEAITIDIDALMSGWTSEQIEQWEHMLSVRREIAIIINIVGGASHEFDMWLGVQNLLMAGRIVSMSGNCFIYITDSQREQVDFLQTEYSRLNREANDLSTLVQEGSIPFEDAINQLTENTEANRRNNEAVQRLFDEIRNVPCADDIIIPSPDGWTEEQWRIWNTLHEENLVAKGTSLEYVLIVLDLLADEDLPQSEIALLESLVSRHEALSDNSIEILGLVSTNIAFEEATTRIVANTEAFEALILAFETALEVEDENNDVPTPTLPQTGATVSMSIVVFVGLGFVGLGTTISCIKSKKR